MKTAVDKDPDMYGMQFNVVGVSDGMSMGTKGMTYSLPSREIIADSMETMMEVYQLAQIIDVLQSLSFFYACLCLLYGLI